jgi:hypothetical protein
MMIRNRLAVRPFTLNNQWQYAFEEANPEIVPVYAVVILGVLYMIFLGVIELFFIRCVSCDLIYFVTVVEQSE